MIVTGIVGFCLGMFLPFIAGRFGKILPADPGTILLKLVHVPAFSYSPNVARRRCFYGKWMKLLLYAAVWGIVLSSLFLACRILLDESLSVWAMFYCTIVCICMIIDGKYFLLPDFFTLPLLLVALISSLFVVGLPTEYSLIGAVFGYIVSVLSVFIVGLNHKAEFGAGDVKMVTALGAWLGAPGLNFTLLLAFLFFAVQSVILSKRNGAFGPALGLAALISFFIVYAK